MKETPFIPNSDDEYETTASMLLDQIYATMRPPLMKTLKSKDPGPLRETLDLMRRAEAEVLGQKSDEDINTTAHKTLRSIINQTELVADLFDDDKTTDSAYQSFHNKIIAEFIREELGFGDDTAQVESDEYFLLYRHFYSDSQPSNTNLPGLALIAWDKKKNVILPITFALHPAILDEQGEQFVKNCMGSGGRSFIGQQIIAFAKDNEIVERMQEFDNDKIGIEIMPQVISPTPSFCQKVLTECQANDSIENVFDDLTPDQFS